MTVRRVIWGDWHFHLCACGEQWQCNKRDCRNTDDCTACEMQQQEDYFRARGDSAEQLEIPMEHTS